MQALDRAVVQEVNLGVVETYWHVVGSEATRCCWWCPWSTLRGRGRESVGQQCMGCTSSILLLANPLFSCSGLEQST